MAASATVAASYEVVLPGLFLSHGRSARQIEPGWASLLGIKNVRISVPVLAGEAKNPKVWFKLGIGVLVPLSVQPAAHQPWSGSSISISAKTAYIERGSPWENGYIESFNARLRDELLDGEIFYTLREAQIVIESWRRHYNTIRPHASLGYKPPAPQVFVPAFAAWPAALRHPGSAGHASATASLKLTFNLDHSVGANHCTPVTNKAAELAVAT